LTLPGFEPRNVVLLWGERVSQLEEIEPAKVGVVRAEGRDAVLPQDCREEGIRDEVAPCASCRRDLTVDLPEPVQLGDHPNVRKLEQCMNVALGLALGSMGSGKWRVGC